jgi:non-ribosomal peptide synthetase component F
VVGQLTPTTALGATARGPGGDGPGTAPLSVAQEALYYQSLLAPDRITYNEVLCLRKDGDLDAGLLAAAFAELVRRHAAWRTTFDTLDGAPVQVIGPAPPPPDLGPTDLGHLQPEEAERRAVALVAERGRVPFDLRRGPLVRPWLVRFPGGHHRLYVSIHHVVFDGVSIYRVVLPELVAIYRALAAGLAPPPAAPAADYADYARWQQDWVAGPRAAARLEYWRRRLRDLPAARLPADRERDERCGRRGGMVPVGLGREETAALEGVARAHRASLFHVLATAWALFLSRHTDSDEVVTATAADMRQRPEFHGVVGYCLTPLVLRVDLAGAATVGEALRRVRDEALDGLDHLAPFERVVRELPDAGGGAANPVYQTMLVFEPPGGRPHPEWSLQLMDAEAGDAVGATHGLDLELQLDQLPDGEVTGRLIYDADLFSRDTAARFARRFERVAGQMARSGSALALVDLALETPAERRRQLVEWNATRTPAPPAAPSADLAPHAGGARGPADAPDPEGVLLARWLARRFDLGPHDTVVVLPDAAARVPLLALSTPLVAGARVLCAPEGLDGAGVSRLISAEKASFTVAPPATWAGLVATGLRGARGLRLVTAAGPVSAELAGELLRRARVVWNVYASALTGECNLLGRLEAGEPVTVGRPVANTRAYVVDRHGRTAPAGVWGELVVEVVDPAAGDDTWGGPASGPGAGPAEGSLPAGCGVRTGDRARWLADGRLQVAPGGR